MLFLLPLLDCSHFFLFTVTLPSLSIRILKSSLCLPFYCGPVYPQPFLPAEDLLGDGPTEKPIGDGKLTRLTVEQADQFRDFLEIEYQGGTFSVSSLEYKRFPSIRHGKRIYRSQIARYVSLLSSLLSPLSFLLPLSFMLNFLCFRGRCTRVFCWPNPDDSPRFGHVNFFAEISIYRRGDGGRERRKILVAYMTWYNTIGAWPALHDSLDRVPIVRIDRVRPSSRFFFI